MPESQRPCPLSLTQGIWIATWRCSRTDWGKPSVCWKRLKLAAQGVCTSLWLDVLGPVDVPSLASRLVQAPTRIAQWKESSSRAGALMALTLVQGYFPTAEGLSTIKKGIPIDDQGEEVDLDEIFPRFHYAAS